MSIGESFRVTLMPSDAWKSEHRRKVSLISHSCKEALRDSSTASPDKNLMHCIFYWEGWIINASTTEPAMSKPGHYGKVVASVEGWKHTPDRYATAANIPVQVRAVWKLEEVWSGLCGGVNLLHSYKKSTRLYNRYDEKTEWENVLFVTDGWVTANARILISHILSGLWKNMDRRRWSENTANVWKRETQTDEGEQSQSNLYADETWKPDLQTFYME